MTATAVPTAGGDAVRVELHGHVLLVTINRPDARNAVNTQVALGSAKHWTTRKTRPTCGS